MIDDKVKPQQTLPLDPDVDELLERMKALSGRLKRAIGNDMIRTEARRRGLLPRTSEPGREP